MKGTSIAGRKNKDGIDSYQTPTWVVEKILDTIPLFGSILEPCSGSGRFSRAIEARGHTVTSQDLRTDDSVYGEKGVDFFSYHTHHDTIITNPPYDGAQDFILHALEIADTVIMLLKLQFLESTGRYEFFKTTGLRYVYVLCKRVTMYPEGIEEPKNSGTIAYACYVWEKGYQGEPMIRWIL